MEVTLAGIEHWREIEIDCKVRLTYVETELRAGNEATRIVMIRNGQS